jgi:hypothetical protein
LGFSRAGSPVVLKFLAPLIFITILFSTQNSFAKKVRKPSKKDRLYFSKAKRAFRNEQYQRALTILKRRYNLSGPGVPAGAHLLAAYSYEKLGKFENARNIFRYLIRRRFRKMDASVLKAFSESGNADDLPEDVPEKLVDYYAGQGILLARLYIRDYHTEPADVVNKYRKQALMYAAIAEEVEHREDEAEDIVQLIEGFDNQQTKKVYHEGYFLTAGLTSWRDVLTLTAPSGTVNEIKTTTKGWRFGAGWRKANDFWEFNIHGSVALTSATVGENTSAFSYFQSSVPVTAYTIAPGIFWKPLSGGAAIGASLPIMYRSGDYTEPGNGFVLDNTSIISFGLMLEGQWVFDQYTLGLKFGKMSKLSSSIWTIDLGYTL